MSSRWALGLNLRAKPSKHLHPIPCPRRIEKKLVQARARLDKMLLDMRIKDELKTVALGTSKINYMDPRITIAWCKKHDVPIEKVRESRGATSTVRLLLSQPLPCSRVLSGHF